MPTPSLKPVRDRMERAAEHAQAPNMAEREFRMESKLGTVEDGEETAHFTFLDDGPNFNVDAEFAFDVSLGMETPGWGPESALSAIDRISREVEATIQRFERFFPS